MTNDQEVGRLVRTAIEAQTKGDLPGAEAACRAALVIDQDNAFVQNQLALLLHIQGKSEAGLKILAGLLGKKPGFPDALFTKGKILFDLGKFKDAISPLQQAAKSWPYKDIRPMALVGKTYLQMRRYKLAVEWLKPAVEKNPRGVSAKNDLGLALKNVQEHDAAIKVFEEAISGAPDNPVLYFNLGLTQLDLAKHTEAENLFLKAIQIKPDYLEAHEALNETIGAEREDFLSSYVRAIKNAPKSLDLRLQYVDTLLRTKNEEGGVRALTEIEAVFGENPRSLWRLAKIQITQGEKSEALATLDKAMALNSGSIELKLEAAKLLIRLGDYKKALDHLEKGLGFNEFHQELIAYQVMCWRLLEDERAGLMNNFDTFVGPAKIPVPDGYANLGEFNKALLIALNHFHKPNLQPRGQSLRLGTQTLTSLFSMEVREIQEARRALSKTITAFIEGLPESKTHPFLKRKTGNFEFSGSWSIQLKDQGFHINHVHPEGWISTSYYVDVPQVIKKGTDNQGCIKFGESPLKLGDREEIGKIVRPIEGLLVMFPSYMFHGTFPFSSPETRTTMPFDIIPV